MCKLPNNTFMSSLKEPCSVLGKSLHLAPPSRVTNPLEEQAQTHSPTYSLFFAQYMVPSRFYGKTQPILSPSLRWQEPSGWQSLFNTDISFHNTKNLRICLWPHPPILWASNSFTMSNNVMCFRLQKDSEQIEGAVSNCRRIILSLVDMWLMWACEEAVLALLCQAYVRATGT